MIRILHIVTYMGRGGLETMLMNYYRHIDRDKIQFDFLVHRDFEADYDEEILSLGGRIYHVSRLIPWSRSYREELKTFFRKHPEYKIVHVHQDCLSAVALQCAKECGVPVRIAHSHVASQDKNLKYLIKLYYKRKIPSYATDLLACSHAAGDFMFPGHSYQIMKNAIEVDRFTYNSAVRKKIRDEFGFDDKIVIGHIGRFFPQKNHSFLIQVFAECLKREPKARLLLVGDGELRKDAEAQVNELGIADKVIFTGVRGDVEELLQAMDVFLFPSLYEGLPVTMIEAQASGLPCVISDQVSKECIITDDLVKIQSLKNSAGVWADIVLELAAQKRVDHSEEVKTSGYDVKNAAARAEKFYIKKAQVNC